MAIKLKNGTYRCLFCEFTDPNPSKVNDHRDQEHDYVLVPMTNEMLSRLVQYIFTQDMSLIDERTYNILKNYLNSFRNRDKS